MQELGFLLIEQPKLSKLLCLLCIELIGIQAFKLIILLACGTDGQSRCAWSRMKAKVRHWTLEVRPSSGSKPAGFLLTELAASSLCT